VTRRRLTASTKPLTERQMFVLNALVEINADNLRRRERGERVRDGAYAFQVADRLVEAELQSDGRVVRGYANGAANTLASLARRGLVSGNDTGGVFVQCLWSITDAGRAALTDRGLA